MTLMNKTTTFLLFIALLIALRAFEASIPKRFYAKVYYRIGQKLQSDSQLDEALKIYKKAIYHDPTFRPAYFQMARIYDQTGQQELKSLNDEKVVNLGPDFLTDNNQPFAQTNEEIGLLLVEKNNLPEAIPYLQRAVTYDASPEYYTQLALTYHQLGDQEKTLETLELMSKSYYNLAQPLFQRLLLSNN